LTKVSDNITLGDLVRRAARALTRAGLEHRIDIYRDIEVDDPAVQKMLGRPHRVRVRIKITAQSLLFEERGSGVAANDTGEQPTVKNAGDAARQRVKV
jgi:hypothetical protein